LQVDTFLAESALRFPEKTGLISGRVRMSYGALDAAANAMAAGLIALGAKRGDRIVLHLDNGAEAVVAIFGALRAGCVFVSINPTVKSEKLAYVLKNCAASILISDQQSALIADTIRGLDDLRAVIITRSQAVPADPQVKGPRFSSFAELLQQHAGEAPRVAAIDLDLAALIYTSGSTGRPKGVMLTHANMVAAATSISSYLGLTNDDVVLDALPLSFDYGLYQLLLTARAGGTAILERAFVYPSTVLKLIDEHRVTGLPVVPMMAALLLRQDLSAYDLSSLRFISNTGAVLTATHVAALRQQLPHVKIFKMYGLTECKRVSYLDPAEIDNRPDSVGKPMDNVEVYVIDESGQRRDTGVGELVVRGSNVMEGYWGAPEATDQILKPGPYPGERVLHTGDIFRIDNDGFMYFMSRTDDVIKCRGQKVSPREVEAVIQALPGINEVFVLGVADTLAGDVVKAFVTLDHSAVLSEQEIQLHCAKHLEDFMIPKFIEIVEVLPRTTTGKVARATLQAPSA